MEYGVYVLIGITAGILAGLLGISGGVITVPCLFFLFKGLGFPHAYLMHFAIGTSLAAMIFNSLSATYFHHKRGAVLWDVIKKMVIGIVLGTVLGAYIADISSGVFLQIGFGIFACLLGLYFFKPRIPHDGAHRLPSSPKLSFIGFALSSISTILGIGGGIFAVPIFMAYKVSDKKAIGTSSAITLFITSLAASAYLYFGLGAVSFPSSIGFLYLPAFFVIGATTFLAAPYGVKLAHTLPSPLIRKIFACALIATGLSMLLSR